jgi:hypothetical protein
MISVGGRANPSGKLAQGSEDEPMAQVTAANVEQFLQELEKRAQSQQELISKEQERQKIEASLNNLKQLRTMSERINLATDIDLEHLHKLWQHDPEFMKPILIGLVKRPSRIEQRDRLFYRIREGDLSPKHKPDYTDLGFSLDEWYINHPEQFPKIFQNTRLLEATQAVSYAVDRAGDEDCNELAGLKNALVCMHDLLKAFQDAGLTPPGIYTRVHRRLEKRRAHLDPDHPKSEEH